jgi:hypothetical protein
MASTAPGLFGARMYGGAGHDNGGSSSEDDSMGSSRESSVVGTPHDAQLASRPLVYSASSATMAVDVQNAAGAELYQKSVTYRGTADVEGGLKKLLAAEEGKM